MNCLELTKPFLYIFTDSVPNLLYYSHFPVAIVAIIIGFLIIKKVHSYKSVLFLFVINIVLASLSIVNVILWTNDRVENIMFFWFISQLLFILLPLTCLVFFYSFLGQERKIPNIYLYTWSIMYIAIVPIIVFSLNINYFDVQNCVVVENNLIINYQTAVLWIVVMWIFFSVVKSFFDKKIGNIFKKEVCLLGVSLIFLLTILYFTWNSELFNIPFEYEQLGFIGLAIFLITLVFTVVKFELFNIKLISTQALVWSVSILVGSQLFFVDTVVNTVLISITLLLSLVLGFMIIRSVKNEIVLREKLETANKQQTNLLHFISHQVKGFFTKSRNAFSGLLEGDYGPIPETARYIIQEGFDSDNRGVETVQQILNAANLKTGQTTYVVSETNLVNVVKDIILSLKPASDKKYLAINFNPPVQNLIMKLDTYQITQALKNLIDNSIKYTPSGKIDITLEVQEKDVANKKVVIKVSDTGVGISAEDMPKLFSEGGRGKESIKVNVDSTGYGLYIVKNIIEAHGGSVAAHSDGVGKGSVFTVVLPMK